MEIRWEGALEVNLYSSEIQTAKFSLFLRPVARSPGCLSETPGDLLKNADVTLLHKPVSNSPERSPGISDTQPGLEPLMWLTRACEGLLHLMTLVLGHLGVWKGHEQVFSSVSV